MLKLPVTENTISEIEKAVNTYMPQAITTKALMVLQYARFGLTTSGLEQVKRIQRQALEYAAKIADKEAAACSGLTEHYAQEIAKKIRAEIKGIV